MPALRVRVLSLVAFLAAGAAVAGCAASRDPLPSGPGVRALFRGGQGAYSDRSRTGWYSPRKPPQFDKTGPVAWSTDPFARRSGLSAWIVRVFSRKPKPGAPPELPTALAPARSGLPVPSIVYVTNLQTYATVRVRVEQRASMGSAVIGLSPQAAGPLGVQPGQPLMVRIRYAGPVVAYREPQPPSFARRRPARSEPQLAAAAPAAVGVDAAAAAPSPKPAVVAQVAQVVSPPPVLRPAFDAPPPSALRIQAGAFADHRNAERAVVMLVPAGRATVEPLQREGRTLYRVVLRAPSDARAAEALRAKVVGIGFADARLVRPS